MSLLFNMLSRLVITFLPRSKHLLISWLQSPSAVILEPRKIKSATVVTYGCESWTVKKAEHRRIDAFELWCWIRLLRVPWTARRSNQPILKEINPEYSLEGLMLKLQYLGSLVKNWLMVRKDADAGKDWRPEEKRMTEDKMVGWHHRLNGHEFEHAPGDDKGQGSLACCSSWGCRESDTTQWLMDNKSLDNISS